MGGSLGVSDVVVGTSVVGSCVALAEVVGLNLRSITTQPLPVNLVQIVRLEDEARDNTLAERGLDGHIDLAEEDVLVGTNRGSITFLVDGENSTLVGVIDLSAIKLVEVLVLALGEVNVDGAAESLIGGAG